MRAVLLKIVEALRAGTGPRALDRHRACPVLHADARKSLQMPTKAYASSGGRRVLPDVDGDVYARVDGCLQMLTKVDVPHPSPCQHVRARRSRGGPARANGPKRRESPEKPGRSGHFVRPTRAFPGICRARKPGNARECPGKPVRSSDRCAMPRRAARPPAWRALCFHSRDVESLGILTMSPVPRAPHIRQIRGWKQSSFGSLRAGRRARRRLPIFRIR